MVVDGARALNLWLEEAIGGARTSQMEILKYSLFVLIKLKQISIEYVCKSGMFKRLTPSCSITRHQCDVAMLSKEERLEVSSSIQMLLLRSMPSVGEGTQYLPIYQQVYHLCLTSQRLSS